MEQLVRVQKRNDDGTAQVVHLRQSACSGDCHKCSGCGAAQETLVLTAKNPIGAKPGDLVVIQSGSGPVLAAAAVLYIVPLILFFLGYALGAALWQRGGLVGCVAFLLGVGIAAVYDRYTAKHKKTMYTITGFGKQA
ncbi:MAG: SoxR reducing system RseC family protein [Oscillospiraceae bacterium]|nr:SoxR reducing system RseC family protein [Oscillospiraceae bacterium]